MIGGVLRWRSNGTRGDSNVRDLLVGAIGAAYWRRTTLEEQRCKGNSNVRDLLVGGQGAFNWIMNFYAKEQR